MVRRIRRYRKYSHQNGAGFFDIIKKAGKFLGSKKARKILEYGRKGLDIAEKAQRGIAGFTGQNGAGMRGGAGRRMRRGNHPITPTQVRQLLHLIIIDLDLVDVVVNVGRWSDVVVADVIKKAAL